MSKKLSNKSIIEIRKTIKETLEDLSIGKINYNDIKRLELNILPTDLERVIFDKTKDRERRDLKFFVFDPVLVPYLMRLIDFADVSFNDVDIRCIDFTGSKGVEIDPETVYDRSLWGAKLNGVKIVGALDGVYIEEADFTGSIFLEDIIVNSSHKKYVKSKNFSSRKSNMK